MLKTSKLRLFLVVRALTFLFLAAPAQLLAEVLAGLACPVVPAIAQQTARLYTIIDPKNAPTVRGY